MRRKHVQRSAALLHLACVQPRMVEGTGRFSCMRLRSTLTLPSLMYWPYSPWTIMISGSTWDKAQLPLSVPAFLSLSTVQHGKWYRPLINPPRRFVAASECRPSGNAPKQSSFYIDPPSHRCLVSVPLLFLRPLSSPNEVTSPNQALSQPNQD